MSSDLQRCVDFTQRLIRTPSLPGEEGAIAELVATEMRDLGYADVELDDVGNVVGRVPGSSAAPAVMFNTHLDHVDVGEAERWPHSPFGAEIHDDKIWGRGAVDIKGPLAAQVYGVGRLPESGTTPAGDVWVTAVVQEEVGGLGARHLNTYLTPPLAVIGEPSGNTLRRGHRGRCELIVHITGRSAHASVPHEGANPLEVLAPFIVGLGSLDMAVQPDLGRSTVAPTLIRTDQISSNVIPAEIWLTCDWRLLPDETAESARTKLEHLVADCLIEGTTADVTIPQHQQVAHTGVEMVLGGEHPAYVLGEDHPAVRAARQTLEGVLGPVDSVGTWRFATDGGHFSQAGVACIGFGPGDELLAHTVNEHIEIDALRLALDGNEALALGWAPKAAELTKEAAANTPAASSS